MNPIKIENNNITLYIVVTPKSSKDAIVGLIGEEIKITITAPPIDGKANAYIQKYLGKIFKTAKSNVEIQKGETSKHKVVLIKDFKNIPNEISQILESLK